MSILSVTTLEAAQLFSKNWARSIAAPATQFSTPRPIRSCKSRRTKMSFRSRDSMKFVVSQDARQTDFESVGSSRDRSAERREISSALSRRHDFSMPPPHTILNALQKENIRVIRGGQNQRHFRRTRYQHFVPDRVEPRGYGANNDPLEVKRRRAHFHQPCGLRYALWTPA